MNEKPSESFKRREGMVSSKPGREADVSRQTVNAIETEKYGPNLPLAFKIAEVFSMKIEEIFTSNHKK